MENRHTTQQESGHPKKEFGSMPPRREEEVVKKGHKGSTSKADSLETSERAKHENEAANTGRKKKHKEENEA